VYDACRSSLFENAHIMSDYTPVALDVILLCTLHFKDLPKILYNVSFTCEKLKEFNDLCINKKVLNAE